MLALPLISLAVFLLVLFCIILSLLCRPSAKRTVLLNTPLTPLLKGKKGKPEEPTSSETANPIYMWMVQPKEETGLKEGRFTLTRSSQRTFSVSDQSGRSTRRSSSLSSVHSSGLSRSSSLALSRTDSITTQASRISMSTRASESDSEEPHHIRRSRTVSCSEEGGVGGRQQQQDGEAVQPPPLAARSWLYSFLKPKE